MIMDSKRLEDFRKRLEVRRRSLTETVTRTRGEGRTVIEDHPQDVADLATSYQAKEFLFSTSTQERRNLQMVEEALQRIHGGVFGECISCGREINPKRLDAVPWARYCIECQEKIEQGVLQDASSVSDDPNETHNEAV
jgi:DnaK suppressor protein